MSHVWVPIIFLVSFMHQLWATEHFGILVKCKKHCYLDALKYLPKKMTPQTHVGWEAPGGHRVNVD